MDRILAGLSAIIGVPLLTVLYIYLVEWFVGLLPYRGRAALRPWLWLLPAFILLGAYLVYPSIQTFLISFEDARAENNVGWENYRYAFTNKDMLVAFRNNLLWMIVFTGLTVVLGLTIAILADRVSYEPLVKGSIFLPMAISYVAAGIIWKLMYEYDPAGQPQTGVLNAFFTFLYPSFEPRAWMTNRPINNILLNIVGVWMWTGFSMVILSAGLKSIPNEILEAARVDGANEWQILRRITLPMLSSTIAVVTTTMMINVLKIFDIVYVMTNGNYETEVIANRMYKEMFNFRHFGRASAIAVILFLAIVPIMLYNVRRFREQEALR